MKILHETDYRIQSVNRHLKNILEENYYIELGCINYKILTRLLEGEEIDIQDCIYDELAEEGIGQITNDENSLSYQISYLLHLRQKSSSCKIFLTCNILKYTDKNNKELYAPIVLIPISIDYQNGKIIKSSEVIPNKLLINELSIITQEDIDIPERINGLTQIDDYSFELAKKTKFEFQIGNFLTYANVEYPDFKGGSGFFDIERSIYETTPKEINEEYFQTVNAILPTNIIQKHILLKAAKGESFAVDGKIGSGKTYTILNIIADKISKNKKVLYVNQDSDAISLFEKSLRDNHMGAFTYNFERIYPIDEQTELLLTELKSDSSIEGLPNELFEFEEAKYKKHHGFTYKEITEKIAYLKNKYRSLETIHIEPRLEHFEINQVSQRLERIENNLKYIDPLKENIWINFENYYNYQNRLEVINSVTEYKDAQLEFNKYLYEFCTRYDIVIPTNFEDAHRLISDVKIFSLTKVPPRWSDAKVYKQAIKAISVLEEDIKKLNELEKNYRNLVVPNYNKGDVERLLDIICYNHLKMDNDQYINQLLSPYTPLEGIISGLINERKHIRYTEYEISQMLGMRDLPNNIYPFLIKLEKLLAHTPIQPNWIKMCVFNPKEHYIINGSIEELIIKAQELQDEITLYAIKPEMFKYEGLKLLTNNEKFEKIISKNYDRKIMRNNKKSADKLYQSILEYMSTMDDIVKLVSKYHLSSNSKMDDFCSSYRDWIDFTNGLEEVEYDFLVALVERNDVFYLLKNNNLLNLISEFNELSDKINNIFNHMAIYGIHIDGNGILEQLGNIDDWIDYLNRVIKAKESLYNIYLNNMSITHKDIINIVNMDREYFGLFQKTDEQNNFYYNLLGESYQGLYTDCSSVYTLIEHFEAFQNKLSNKRKITTLLSTFGFKQMVEEYSNLEALSERVIRAHRQFSRFFKGGLTMLLECDLNKCVQIIQQYELKTNQLAYVFTILESLRYFDKLGLKTLSEGIKTSLYTKNLVDRYIYSTFKIYREELILQNPILANPAKMWDYFDIAESYEQAYGLNNISDLIEKANNIEKNIKTRRNISSHFIEYNKLMENEYRHCLVFLANTNVFNSDLNLSSFDTIIVDDCHIASSNKYHRIEEGRQVILFGDKNFRTSISNSILNRINPASIVHLNRRYYPIGDCFKNDYSVNNQYIYKFNTNIDIQKHDSIQSIVEMLVYYHNRDNNPNRVVNIIVFSSLSKRQVYTELVTKLLENMNGIEVLKLLSTKINIISGEVEDACYADDVVILFDDMKDFEPSLQELIFKNFTVVRNNIVITYIDQKEDKKNKEIEQNIHDLIKKPTPVKKNVEGVLELIINKFHKKGVKANPNLGVFDLVLKSNNNTNIGIIIEGNNANMPYYSFDDYQFFCEEYRKHGWEVFVFYMEDIIDNLDKRVDEVVSVAENKITDTVQLSFDVEEPTNE